MAAVVDFLGSVPEKADANQYWYSPKTVDALKREIVASAGGPGARVAFLSTPSVYFAFTASERANFTVMDYDTDFERTAASFVKYDFNKPGELPAALHGTFDMVVIDPPFITDEVWTLYAEAAKLLLRSDGSGKTICTTILENEALLARLLGTKRARFLPSIPNLVYQYSVFCSGFEPAVLCDANPEIPE